MSAHAPSSIPTRTTDDWDVTTSDGDRQVTITWTKNPRNRLDGFLFDLFGTSRERDLTLDSVGTTVWTHCDGEHTVSEIAALVTDEHDPERVEPVDETLAHFLMQLEERDLIRFENPMDE